ncbi:MAG: O-antigen ligase family protein [Caldilineaceae bacterium]|nr:O-antigen ligase family protein [Caldilineaceae bacterium]
MLRDTAPTNPLHRLYQFPAHRFPASGIWLNILIFTAAASSGLLIGFYVLATESLPFVDAVLLGLIVIAPFGLIIASHLLGGLRRLLIVALLVDMCLGIDIHLFYDETVVSVSAIPGLDVSVVTLSLVALYAWWILEHLTGSTEIHFRSWLAHGKPLVTYLVFTFASLIVAKNWLLASFEINMIVQGLFLYIYIIYAVGNRQQLMFVVTVLVLGLGLQGLIMIGLKATGGKLDIVLLSAEPDPWGRLSGTVGGPNQSAAFLVMWLSLTFGMMLTPASFWLKLVGMGATMMALAGLVFTFSRGGWIAFAIAVTLISVVALSRGWMPLYVPFVVGIVGTAAIIPMWPYIMDRLFGDDGGSVESRLPLLRMALQIIRDHPFLGVGANNYITVLPVYVTSEYTMTWIRVVHNKFLLIWAESGLGALIAFIWFLLDTLQRGWRVIQVNDPYLSPLALGLTAALLGWIAHMQVALFHDAGQVLTICLVAGLIVAMERMARNENDDASSPDRV